MRLEIIDRRCHIWREETSAASQCIWTEFEKGTTTMPRPAAQAGDSQQQVQHHEDVRGMEEEQPEHEGEGYGE